MSSQAPFHGSARLRQLGKYRVVARIGAGGMAAVYKAIDQELRQPVALKVLPPELAGNPTSLKRFEREARAAAKLNHPNIVAVYELGEDRGTHFIAMEYVEGTDLQRYLAKHGKLSVQQSLRLVVQVARALDHAHHHGVVHRDIKPSNILIAKAGQIKVADLGLALDQTDEDENRLTRAGTMIGTVDYIAPEQAKSSRHADIRSDLYALGCVFYHTVTGRPPFPDGDKLEKLYKHVHVMPADPRDFRPDLPEPVIHVLGRLLSKRPEDRYQTPADLVFELEKVNHLLSLDPPASLADLSDGQPSIDG